MKHNKKSITGIEVISLIISIVAFFTSILFFVLPLTKSKLVIDNPSNIYFMHSNSYNYDEIIIPLVFSNYGSFVRSINKIEATINFKENLIPIRPFFEYDKINRLAEKNEYSLFSSFVINPNEGIKKNVGFKFDIVNFSKPELIPNVFHFEPNQTYIVNIRLYTTQNSFFGQKTEIIQAIYGFETKEFIEPSDVLNVSKQTFSRISDSHIFDY